MHASPTLDACMAFHEIELATGLRMQDFVTKTGTPSMPVLDTHKMAAPTARLGNLRVFTSKDIERISRYFEGKKPSRRTNESG
jgi:hypothetical protein